VTRLGVLNSWELWAHLGTVNADAAIGGVFVVALLWLHIQRVHLWVAILCGVVDLEGRANKRLLVTEELEHLGIVLGTTANQVHGPAVGAAKLDLLAAVIEARAIFLGHELVELCHKVLAVLFDRVGNIDEQ
jgi:hypothetical protein